MKQRNLVAKYSRQINKSAVMASKKQKQKQIRKQKHKLQEQL